MTPAKRTRNFKNSSPPDNGEQSFPPKKLQACLDDTVSYGYLIKAAEKGDPDMQAELGRSYYLGKIRSTPQSESDSDEEALKWFRKAENTNHPKALNGLGVMGSDPTKVRKRPRQNG